MVALNVKIATTADQLDQARALRHDVFVTECGADAASEADRFDASATHLIVTDPNRPDRAVVGTLRLALGAAYTAQEFDLSALHADPRALAEIGRVCLHADYRGGFAGAMLLAQTVDLLRARDVGLLVGTGSFPGRDATHHLPALRALRDAACAPAHLRPIARGDGALQVTGQGNPSDMARVPPLIKSYIRAGAWVGEGAWKDTEFNTIDICLVMDMARLRLPQAVLRARGTR